MTARIFPRTGAAITRLGYGGAAIGLTNYLGAYDAQAERAASVAAVRLAADSGVTYFDTAPGYGAGLSEEIFGEALEGLPGLTLATKVIVADAPEASELNVTVRLLPEPPQTPPPVAAQDMDVVEAGRLSVTTVEAAMPGPLLVTVIV